MNAGKMRHRITFKVKTVTGRDAFGGETVTWGNVGTTPTVWAEALPLRGKEFMAARQLSDELSVKFRVRYRSDVIPEWRIEWDSNTFEVVEVIHVDGKKEMLEIMCRSTHV